jgi:hypothetical protein
VIVLAVRAQSATHLAALAFLLVIFNIGYVTAPVRDPFLTIFAAGVAGWCIAATRAARAGE